MFANERIRLAIVKALNLEYPVVSSQPGRCLQAVREVIEHAFDWPSHELYRRYLSDTVEENTTGTPWARDMQRSLRNQGLAVPPDERLPGDLAFCAKLGAPYGHVVLLLSFNLAYENTSTQRGVQVDGYNRISRVDTLPCADHWEFFRLNVEA